MASDWLTVGHVGVLIDFRTFTRRLCNLKCTRVDFSVTWFGKYCVCKCSFKHDGRIGQGSSISRNWPFRKWIVYIYVDILVSKNWSFAMFICSSVRRFVICYSLYFSFLQSSIIYVNKAELIAFLWDRILCGSVCVCVCGVCILNA